MQKRFIDGIQKKASKQPDHPPEPAKLIIPPKALSEANRQPTVKVKRRKRLWFLSIFLILIIVFLTSFWRGLLGEKMALIRLFLGLNGKYLVLFQNNTELRPGGGFIGSFAEVEVKNGLIKNWYFETNVHKRDKKFLAQKCIPLAPKIPNPVWPNGCMIMASSNWSPDFQESAEQVAWFYKQEGGNRVDGVIALDTTLFTDILRLIGPIQMPKYNLTITADNFVKETQYYVEKAYFEDPQNKAENEPKTILKDMMPIVLERLKNPKLTCTILTILKNNLREKHLLFSFKDSGLMKITRKYNWGGEVKQTSGDYLYINNANLGGMKSSLNVKQNILLKVKVQDDGSILNTLSITRLHQGTGAWPDGTNQNYTRVLLPKGSALVSKQGIDAVDFYEELDKTIFGFWTTVAPQESKAFQISYLLPFKIGPKYNLLIQKQPGALADQLNFILEGTSRWRWEGKIDKDKIIEIDLTRKD